MARDSAGNFTLSGTAFVNGTTIDSTAMNAKLNDLATEMTDSLSRSGKGGLLSALRFIDGLVSAPAISFTQETGTGFYRAGAGDVRLSVLGVDILKLTSVSRVWNRVTATADSTCSSNVTPVDVTGLTFPCLSGKRYLFRAVLWTKSAASTTGIGFGPKATGAPTTSEFNSFRSQWLDTGVLSAATLAAFADFHAATSGQLQTDAFAPQLDRLDGQFVTTSTGTFQINLVSEVNTSTVTVKAGSYLEWSEM